MTYEERQLEQARSLKTVEYQLEFVSSNLDLLRKVDRRGVLVPAAKKFYKMLADKIDFTPNQLSYIDMIYEKTMQGADLPACKLKIDAKRRTALRYGN